MVIVPGFAATLKSEGAHAAGAQRACLARLAGRGSLLRRWDRHDFSRRALAPWQRGLLDRLGLDADVQRYASAPTSLAAHRADAAGYWMHAEPVHLAAGLDHLVFVALRGALAATAAERAALREPLAEHLQHAGLTLHDDGHGWLVRAPAALELTTSCPEAAEAMSLEHSLPAGPDAGPIRRLMTELQMVLHEHPVNEQRAARGLPAINAIWLWGGGTPGTRSEARALPVAFADHDYVRGLYRLHGQECAPGVRSAEQLLAAVARRAEVLAVVPEADGDLDAAWFAPLARALGAGRIAHLDLVLDDWRLSVGRLAWWRFWRRPRAPAEWLADEGAA